MFFKLILKFVNHRNAIMTIQKILFIAAIAGSSLLASCTCNRQRDLDIPAKEVAKDTTKVRISRYEQALFSIPPENLASGLRTIQPRFAIFLDGDLNDSSNIRQLRGYVTDRFIKANYAEVLKRYPDLKDIEAQLTTALKYFKFYFSDKKLPKVYTYVSGMDFELPCKYADSALIIALDMYLGRDYEFYQSCGLPLFKRQYMDKPYIGRDCMEQIAAYYVYTDPQENTLLYQMVRAGKILYFIDATLPATADSVKIKYTTQQLKWCIDNESKIWAFYIDKKMLYSQNGQENMKLLTDGPFTSGFGKESAPRTAQWIGWQIVRAYMNRHKDISIKNMLVEPDSKKILQQSGYKPKKP